MLLYATAKFSNGSFLNRSLPLLKSQYFKKFQRPFLIKSCYKSQYYKHGLKVDEDTSVNELQPDDSTQISSVDLEGKIEKSKDVLQSSNIHVPSKGAIVHLNNVNPKVPDQQAGDKDPSVLLLNDKTLIDEIHSFLAKQDQNKDEAKKKETFANAALHSILLNPNQWYQQTLDLKKLPQYYAMLSKIRLTGLVVITTVGGYMLAPSMLDPVCLLNCAIGTALTSSGANTINQFLEIPYDSQMNRTKNRVLVKGLLSPLHCILFGAACFGSGVSLLYFGVNEITAALGALNFLLYTCAYTPLKRITIANTWVGSIVGAIPPLMGWTACCGSIGAGGLLMAAILFSWQFPHFNSLSWNLRPDYSRAGYRMMSVTDPGLCRRTTLRYSASMIALSVMAPLCDATTWMFTLTSLPLNVYLNYLAWNFYQEADSKSSRKLFRFTLLHLPALLILMIISKKNSTNNENKVDSSLRGHS